MTDSESSQKILKILSGLYLTLKNIDSKLDKVNEVTEVHIDESSGDVHKNRKILKRIDKLSKKYISESESESESYSDSDSDFEFESTKYRLSVDEEDLHNLSQDNIHKLLEDNIFNLSYDIDDGINDIRMAMQKYFTESRISHLSSKFDERKLISLAEYNYHIKKEIIYSQKYLKY